MRISEEIGKKINIFRKKKGWTVQELGDAICKSKATVSKYEKGQISLDVDTLYDIAAALGVSPEQLLYYAPEPEPVRQENAVPSFFQGIRRLYMYTFDGRNNSLSRSLIEIGGKQADNTYKVMMYMTYDDVAQYQHCENTYTGRMVHYDALTRLVFQNRDTPLEQYTINMLASYLDAPYKWVLNYGLSSRPFMPIAAKALITKKPAAETADFIKALHISKEDIRILKLYNMLAVTG